MAVVAAIWSLLLEGIEGELQEKAMNVAKFMRNLEAAAEAIKEAEA